MVQPVGHCAAGQGFFHLHDNCGLYQCHPMCGDTGGSPSLSGERWPLVPTKSRVKGCEVWVGEEEASNGQGLLQAPPQPEVCSGVHWTPISKHAGQPLRERGVLQREPADRAACQGPEAGRGCDSAMVKKSSSSESGSTRFSLVTTGKSFHFSQFVPVC